MGQETKCQVVALITFASAPRLTRVDLRAPWPTSEPAPRALEKLKSRSGGPAMRAVVPRPDPARRAQRRKLASGTRPERSAKRATKKRRSVRADSARSAQRRKLAGGTRPERSAMRATKKRRPVRTDSARSAQ